MIVYRIHKPPAMLQNEKKVICWENLTSQLEVEWQYWVVVEGWIFITYLLDSTSIWGMQWRQRGILVSQRIYYATYMQRSTMSNGRFGTVLSSNIIMALLLSCIYCTQNNGDRYRQLSHWGPGEASYEHQLFYVRGRLVWMRWSLVISSVTAKRRWSIG